MANHRISLSYEEAEYLLEGLDLNRGYRRMPPGYPDEADASYEEAKEMTEADDEEQQFYERLRFRLERLLRKLKRGGSRGR